MTASIKTFRNLSLTAAGLTVGMLCLTTGSAYAADITGTFTANVVIGPFTGESATGSFTYDDAFVSPTDFSFVDPLNGLIDFSFTFLGQTFTAANDISFPIFPTLGFFAGELLAFDFIVSELAAADNPTAIDEPGIEGLLLTSEVVSLGNNEFATVLEVITASEPEPIPTPALLPGLLGLGVTALRKRQQLAKQEA